MRENLKPSRLQILGDRKLLLLRDVPMIQNVSDGAGDDHIRHVGAKLSCCYEEFILRYGAGR